MSIPKGTEIPRGSSQFAKLVDGKNKFRVMSDIVLGWEGWKDKKPFRHEGSICNIKPEDVDLNQNGQPNINYFWAMVVWNYTDKKIQVLEITQKTVMGPLYELEQNPDWGDLKGYDIEINKKKEGDKTKYYVLGIPPKPLSEEIIKAYKDSDVDLQLLFKGEYPIKNAPVDDIVADDIPFE